jgi:hypothetical protein
MTKGRVSWLAAALVTGLLLVLTTATVTADSQRAFTAKLTLTGAAEVPGPGDPDAVGTAKVQIVPALDRVCVRIDWTGIDGQVWGAHIHGPASTTESAGILVPLLMLTPGAADNLSGTDSLDVCVTDADADAIAANPSAYYLNVHSFPDFNPGAIRAQLD